LVLGRGPCRPAASEYRCAKRLQIRAALSYSLRASTPRELASQELNVHAGADGSAEQNIALSGDAEAG